LVGRGTELNSLLKFVNAVQSESEAKLITIAGESGVGKTRLAEELMEFATQLGFKLLKSKCINETVTPYMPIFEAMRAADMEELVSFEKPPKVEYMNLMSPEGLVMSQLSASDKEMDMDIFSGMLSAVGSFVKDSMDRLDVDHEQQEGNLNSMGYGNYRIVIESRPFGSLVVILSGIPTEILLADMKEAMETIDAEMGDAVRNWAGDLMRVEGINAILHPFFSRYDGVDYVHEPKDRQWRLFENLSKGIRRATHEHPIIFYIDDIHWADPSSLALLHSILKACINDKLLVIGTYRKSDLKALGEGSKHLENILKSLDKEGFLQEMELKRLGDKDTLKLVKEILGGVADGRLGDMIVKDSEGNPLFVMELIDYLKDEDIVDWDGQGWVVRGSLENIGLPERIKDIIASRLSGIPEEYRDILECASVMGEVFYPLALSDALELNKLQFLKILRKVHDDYGLIKEAPDGGGAYTFDHFKIRDYLYDKIPRDMKKEYHRLIATSLNEQFNEGNMSLLMDLAKHSHLGQHPDRVALCLMAGDKAKAEFNNIPAKEFYSWALEDTEEHHRALISESLGEVFFQEGDHEEAEEWFKMALEASADPEQKVMLAAKLGRTMDRQGRTKEALKLLDKNPPDDKTSPIVTAKWRSIKAWSHYRSLDFKLAEHEAGQAINDLGTSGGHGEDIAHCWNTLASVKYGEGMLQEAAKFYKNGITAARGIQGTSVMEVALMNNLSLCERGLGKFKESLKLGMDAHSLASKIGNRFHQSVSLNRIGNVQLFIGKYDMAIDTLTRGLDISMQIGANALTADFLQLRAKCYLGKKMYEKARSDAGEAILNCFDSADFKRFANQTLVEVMVAQEEYDEALVLARDEIVELQKTESKYYFGIGMRNLGLAMWKKGEKEEADKAFRTSVVDLKDHMHAYERALGLRYWGEALADWGETEDARKRLTEARGLFNGMEAEADCLKVDEILEFLE